MRSRWGAGGGGWDGVDVAHLLRNQGERAVALWLDEPIRNLWQAHLVLRRALLPQQLGAKQPAAEADIARVGGGRAPGPALQRNGTLPPERKTLPPERQTAARNHPPHTRGESIKDANSGYEESGCPT